MKKVKHWHLPVSVILLFNPGPAGQSRIRRIGGRVVQAGAQGDAARLYEAEVPSGWPQGHDRRGREEDLGLGGQAPLEVPEATLELSALHWVSASAPRRRAHW